MIWNIIVTLVGFIALSKGADWLVEGSKKLALKFKIPNVVIGLTIVSIGTSLPELIISLSAVFKGYDNLAIGNIVGSNISNVFLILGICSILKPLLFNEELVRFEIPLVIFSTALLYILGNNHNDYLITRKEGLILFSFFLLFIIYNVMLSRKYAKNVESYQEKSESIFKICAKLIWGIIVLKLGGDFVVEGLTKISRLLNIDDKIISLTVLAFSTSLPELITSINATLKEEVDIAIGNVIGSNIFNIFLIIGLTAIIKPIEFAISYNHDIVVFMFGIIILEIIPVLSREKVLSRKNGFAYVISYIAYLVSLIYVFM